VKRAEILGRYTALFCDLEVIVMQTEKRITDDPPDSYFAAHVNFLTKSFLISLCCYLESFLKEIANAYVLETQERIRAAKVPRNLLVWATNRDVKPSDLKFELFELSLTRKDIDAELSGNPFKTAKCLQLLGVDVNVVDEFKNSKELVNTVVAKRNNVIHHNDTAVDISMGDILLYVGHFKRYMTAVDAAFLVAEPLPA
jgi:RiboL-PSP-HEPN